MNKEQEECQCDKCQNTSFVDLGKDMVDSPKIRQDTEQEEQQSNKVDIDEVIEVLEEAKYYHKGLEGEKYYGDMVETLEKRYKND